MHLIIKYLSITQTKGKALTIRQIICRLKAIGFKFKLEWINK